MTAKNNTANMTPCEVAVLAAIRDRSAAGPVSAVTVRASVSFQRGAVSSALLTLKERGLIRTVEQDGQRSTYLAVATPDAEQPADVEDTDPRAIEEEEAEYRRREALEAADDAMGDPTP